MGPEGSLLRAERDTVDPEGRLQVQQEGVEGRAAQADQAGLAVGHYLRKRPGCAVPVVRPAHRVHRRSADQRAAAKGPMRSGGVISRTNVVNALTPAEASGITGRPVSDQVSARQRRKRGMVEGGYRLISETGG